jgi:hypothetical protein
MQEGNSLGKQYLPSILLGTLQTYGFGKMGVGRVPDSRRKEGYPLRGGGGKKYFREVDNFFKIYYNSKTSGGYHTLMQGSGFNSKRL